MIFCWNMLENAYLMTFQTQIILIIPNTKGNIMVCNNRFVPILLDVKIGLLCLNIQSKIIIYNLSITGKIGTDLLCKRYNADQLSSM